MSTIPPQTPERGRCRTRYPSHLSRQLLDDQGKPRPLLHRRGTSHMYETLEDLLKEAGYKETRIFTPEVEQRRGKRDMSAVGGAVVKMFSTWMSKKSNNDNDNDARPSCPPSPLAHRTRAPLSTIKPLQSPSNSSLLTVRPPPSRLRSNTAPQNQHSATRAPPPPPSPTYVNSRARLALRHAQSTPQMDKRRARTQPRPNRVSAKAPPLPATWLESLSAALLSSPRVTPPTTPVKQRTAHPPRKPTVLPHRTPTSVAVTITNVVCRSAPSSRSSSAVRGTPAKIKHKHNKHTTRAAVPVPTLAQTSVCEEQGSAATAWPPHSPHHLPHSPNGATAGVSPSRFGTQPIDMDMDDDEDDELNLTMMLIPSKRQHSIRSLRSVLHHHGGMGGCSAPCSTSASASAYAYAAYARDEVARVRVMRRRMIEESEDEMEAEAVSRGGEGEGEGHWDSGEFLTAKVKRRRSHLPRQWSWAV